MEGVGGEEGKKKKAGQQHRSFHLPGVLGKVFMICPPLQFYLSFFFFPSNYSQDSHEIRINKKMHNNGSALGTMQNSSLSATARYTSR